MEQNRNGGRKNSKTAERTGKAGEKALRNRTAEKRRRKAAGRHRRRTGHRHYKRGRALWIALGIRLIIVLIVIFLFVQIIQSIACIFRKNSEVAETTEESTEVVTTPEETQDPNIVTSNGRELDLRKPMVAVTFDDGPYAPVGNQIMDTIAECGGKVTFFVVGNRVGRYADEVKRMASEGHEIGNHSYDHDDKLAKKDADTVAWEFNACNEEVNKVAGVTPAVIRLPGGIISDTVRQTITQPLISWSVDTKDWKTRNAQSTIEAVVGHVQDGDIILMHELYPSTAEACRTIFPELVNEGYQLVTVSELIQYRASGPLEQGIQYTDFHPSGESDASEGSPTVDMNQETADLSGEDISENAESGSASDTEN